MSVIDVPISKQIYNLKVVWFKSNLRNQTKPLKT